MCGFSLLFPFDKIVCFYFKLVYLLRLKTTDKIVCFNLKPASPDTRSSAERWSIWQCRAARKSFLFASLPFCHRLALATNVYSLDFLLDSTKGGIFSSFASIHIMLILLSFSDSKSLTLIVSRYLSFISFSLHCASFIVCWLTNSSSRSVCQCNLFSPL